MYGIGKKTAWNAWTAYPEVTNTFIDITNTPNSLMLESQHMSHLERFTVLMYSKNCAADSVTDARKWIFMSYYILLIYLYIILMLNALRLYFKARYLLQTNII